MTRYAIYFAPEPQTALWRFGSHALGYDAATGMDAAPAVPPGLGLDNASWSEVTEEPRRYGFHATLKAPFEIASNACEASLLEEAALLAARLEPVVLARLNVVEIGRFIALVPAAPSQEPQKLAAEVVTSLDHLRAPLAAADRARRLKAPLTSRQIRHLDRYGYPYVLEDFRFHMTLTGPIGEAGLRGRIRDGLARMLAHRVPAEPVAIDALTVFRQEQRDARFRIIARFALAGAQGVSEHR